MSLRHPCQEYIITAGLNVTTQTGSDAGMLAALIRFTWIGPTGDGHDDPFTSAYPEFSSVSLSVGGKPVPAPEFTDWASDWLDDHQRDAAALVEAHHECERDRAADMRREDI